MRGTDDKPRVRRVRVLRAPHERWHVQANSWRIKDVLLPVRSVVDDDGDLSRDADEELCAHALRMFDTNLLRRNVEHDEHAPGNDRNLVSEFDRD